MNKIRSAEPQTAVDDVRRVREQIAAQHRGDLRAHCEETNRIVAQFREQLGLKTVQPPSGERRVQERAG